jgi:hypothetical protein
MDFLNQRILLHGLAHHCLCGGAPGPCVHAGGAGGTFACRDCMDNPGMPAAAPHNNPSRPVLIAGGGIGGMATALTLHQIGVPCIVFV